VSTLKSNLPELIKRYLEQTGQTQKQLASDAKIDVTTLSRIINSNQQRLDLRVANQLRQVIGFQPQELIIEVNGE
jgi:transcriptional regulator with XRE-family HTH domain